ncbi:hypothetical protein G7B40_037935 [Aetokthonos hydrillicola Thurmond2011]|uniref:Uncharacterized protein n=1 Tax=Aetokthonos hydrillicola Thurmond2011 TaxID=2712845 RepID=A0AAP5MCG2_9CYAN|nr:hypothetical protein [Aetokthonos hydrillicola]MBO3464130.1 hypothetical protein [Aetokthonos hydrillicola CCALA 1050]MBW4589795.1 hypothetical protein [Aetokthonos hydrillicola CCALA 1050]MDR9900290.1 hypothetical protein [Aetokthonos hydrillicola Thurmond2011]
MSVSFALPLEGDSEALPPTADRILYRVALWSRGSSMSRSSRVFRVLARYAQRQAVVLIAIPLVINGDIAPLRVLKLS